MTGLGVLAPRLGVLALLGVTLSTLTSCSYQSVIERALQTTLNTAWGNTFVRGGLEATAEAKLLRALRAELSGKVMFRTPLGNVWIRGVRWADVNLGTTAPRVRIVSASFSQTSTDVYATLSWAMSWPGTNGASIGFQLDMTSPIGFPDHTVRITNIDATVAGTATVRIPKSISGSVTFSHTVTDTDLNVRATAAGWFWTINISNKVNQMIETELIGSIVGQTFERTFGPFFSGGFSF